MKILSTLVEEKDVTIALTKRGSFYGIAQHTEYGTQEIYLKPAEMIRLLQAVMTDFGKKMPRGMKVIVKCAEEGL